MFGAAGRTEHSMFGPELVDVDSLHLSPQASATLVAGSISVRSEYPEFRCKVHSQLEDFDGLDSSACPTCLECLTWCDSVKKGILGTSVYQAGHSSLLEKVKVRNTSEGM